VTTALRDEAGLRRRGLQLAWFIIVWDVIEGIVAVTAGLLAGSIALVSFGIDSGSCAAAGRSGGVPRCG
jgi:divalent metal cation (Fe/Co/Zn/Cd) transporter